MDFLSALVKPDDSIRTAIATIETGAAKIALVVDETRRLVGTVTDGDIRRGILRGMMRRRAGRIVNIASISGVLGNPGQGNYAASKAGLVGMTKSLAREVASRGITANCIAPGFISTPMTDALTPKQVEAIAAAIPAAKFGKPEDVAAVVAFLASEEASYITGETVHVNGGMVMV